MAKKAAAPAGTPTARKRPARKRSAPRMATAEPASPKSAAAMPSMPSMPSMQAFGDMTKMAKMMTPEQAIELYKANAALALNVINTAIESSHHLMARLSATWRAEITVIEAALE